MAKRFTDTELWDKEWFMNLTPSHKMLLMFLHSKCDQSGVWDPNWMLASAYLNMKVTIEDVKQLKGQISILPNGKVFLPGFIKFQYGKLSKDCKPHIPIYRLLEKHGIDINTIEMAETIGKTHNVTPNQKALVLKQDGYTCCYCGKEKEERNLVVDHIVPRTKGGLDSIENLVASCAPCNSKKWDFSVEEFCIRENLDFELINQRIFNRVSHRVYDTLQEKEEDKEEETEMEKKEGVQGKPKKEVVQIELVYPYDSQRFIETWKVLRNERKWKNKSPAALQSSLNQLSEFDEDYAVDLMMKAISGNYQGVVFSNTKSEYEKIKNGNSTDKKTRFIGGRVTEEAATNLLAAARLHHAGKENAHGNTG